MSAPLIAIDIGNSRIKLGLFAALEIESASTQLPAPSQSLAISTLDWDDAELAEWSAGLPAKASWWIASVNRPASARLAEWIGNRWPIRFLSHSDLPIQAAVEFPEKVGIDRLAGAVAVNRLRDPQRPAIAVGVGTAITVDLISADGVFRGGAILPGIGTSARALDEFTDMLPRSPLEQLSSPPLAVGTSTLAAIHSGLYWGAVGAMRELIAQMTKSMGAGSVQPDVFLTGGAAPSVAQQLGPTAALRGTSRTVRDRTGTAMNG